MRETEVDRATLGFPGELGPLLLEATVFDCSSSAASRTYRVVGPRGTFFLKRGPSELLGREVDLYRYFHRHGMGPRVEAWVDQGETGFLVTEGLHGSDGIAAHHLGAPARLATVFGEALARIHDLPSEGCPFPRRNDEMMLRAERNLEAGVFAAYLLPEGPEAGRKRFEELRGLSAADAVIHGDYCLPNIVLHRFRVSGFLDLGNGGYGDSHHDLFWGLWTLEHNLGTDRYHGTFLDAYGRGRVHTDRIEFHRLLSAFMD